MTELRNKMKKIPKKRLPASAIPILMAMSITVVLALVMLGTPISQNLVLRDETESIVLAVDTPWETSGFRNQATFTNITMNIINPALSVFTIRIWIGHETLPMTDANVTVDFNIYETGNPTPLMTFSGPFAVSSGRIFTASNIDPVNSDFYYAELSITFTDLAEIGQYTVTFETYNNS